MSIYQQISAYDIRLRVAIIPAAALGWWDHAAGWSLRRMGLSGRGCAKTDLFWEHAIQKPFQPLPVVSRPRFRVHCVNHGLN